VKIGFTGTQVGMTNKQRAAVYELLTFLQVDEFHHGDCIGADVEAHRIVFRYFGAEVLHVHPPDKDAKRAFCRTGTLYEPKSYLSRNRDIVNATRVLIAAPQGKEVLYSGTWSTVRYARKAKREIMYVWPDGGIRT